MSRYHLRLGPLRFTSAKGPIGEKIGDGVETAGGLVIPAERSPRAFSLELPVRGDVHDVDPVESGQRLRRQVRALLQNRDARLHGLYFAFDFDLELNGWLIVGSGDLTYTEAGVTFGDYVLQLADTFKVASRRTHREGRRLTLTDLRLSTSPRDIEARIYGTEWAAVPALDVWALPSGVTDTYARASRVPVSTGVREGRDGPVPVLVDLPAGEVVTFEQNETSMGLNDVTITNRVGVTRMLVRGHSIAFGSLASDTAHSWAGLVAAALGVPLENQALGGAVLSWDEDVQPGGHVSVLQDWTPGTDPTTPPESRLDAFWWGVNDLAFIVGDQVPPYKSALRVAAARVRSIAVFEDSHASITYGAGWNTITSGLTNSGTTMRQATIPGSPATITVPSTFLGGTIGIGFSHLGAPGGQAIWTVEVDGTAEPNYTVTPAEIAPGKYTGTVLRLPGLAAGPHTIVLTVSDGSMATYLDYWQIEAQAPPPLLLVKQYQGPIWANLGGPHGIVTDADVDRMNVATQQVADEFAGAFAIATPALYGFGAAPAHDLTDGLHPNDQGHAKIADALLAEIDPGLISQLEGVYGPDQPLGDDSVPQLDNGLARVSFVPYIAGGVPYLAIDAWTTTGWEPHSLVSFAHRNPGSGVATSVTRLLACRVHSWTPERGVLHLTFDNGPGSTGRVAVYVTLARGDTGPRIECYPANLPAGTPAGTLIRVASATAGQVDFVSGDHLVFQTPAGVVPTSILDDSNAVAMIVTGQAHQVNVAVHSGGHAGAVSLDGLARGVVDVFTGATGYTSVTVGACLSATDQQIEAEAMALGATASIEADANATGGSTIKDTQDAMLAATIADAATNLPAGTYEILVRARADGGTGKVAVSDATTFTATVDITAATYATYSLGELTVPDNTFLQLLAWNTAGGAPAVYVDRIVLMRASTAGSRDGLRDHASAVLSDTRPAPVLVAR